MNLHTFGYVCFVHLPSSERTKLSAQSAKCAFLVYSSHQKGFLCYDPKSNALEFLAMLCFSKTYIFFIIMLIHCLLSLYLLYPPFLQNHLLILLSSQRFKPNVVYVRRRRTNIAALPTLPQPPDPIPDPDPMPPLSHSNRISRPPDHYGFSHTSLLATLSSISIPKSYSHGVKHEFWQRAMQDELDAL